jgi:formate dehydrogenase subunit gamma
MQMLSRVAAGLALVLVFALPAGAQQQSSASKDLAKDQQQRAVNQPGNNSEVWRQVRSGQPNTTTAQGREADVLVQPQARFPGQDGMTTAGEAWRKFRNGPITFYGGWLIVLAVAGIAAFYVTKGPLMLHEPTGRLIERFNTIERWAHWSVAISFCVLAVTGIIILFGKHVFLPVIGYTLFAWLTSLAKNLHNFLAPLFMASLVIFILIYIRDNFPEKGDLGWFAGAFAMFWSGKHVPSGRFNAGEKAYFWVGVVALCITLSVTGAIMLFPNFEQLRSTMQQTNVIHAVSAICMTLLALGHIYVGTIGVEGAYRNMRDGVTDETWAKEHHQYWYEGVKGAKRS